MTPEEAEQKIINLKVELTSNEKRVEQLKKEISKIIYDVFVSPLENWAPNKNPTHVSWKQYEEIKHAAFVQLEVMRAQRDRYKTALEYIAGQFVSFGSDRLSNAAKEALKE
jgi:hypothetical protein